MAELILETSFEELKGRFPDSQATNKLMEFVEPLPDIEAAINEIAASLANSGKMAFVLGRPGTGKSTFIESLGWRPHLRLRKIEHLNANTLTEDGSLAKLFGALSELGKTANTMRDKGPTCVVIDYLENLVDFDPEDIKGFFRRLNGLLRTHSLLILWPVTEEAEVGQMRAYAADVSGTLFYRDRAVIPFSGPNEQKFVDIAKRTISVLNDGRELSDFSLTSDDLEEILANEFGNLPSVRKTLREYLELVKERWRVSTNHQAKLREKIPKSTEVWFVFSYPDAESVVGQFVRKSQRVEDAWSAIHDKFFEYVHSNTQRSSIWDAKRLQLALYGAIKTRVLYLPTNTLISCVAAYTSNAQVQKLLVSQSTPDAWKDKAAAKRTLMRTALYKQTMGEALAGGKRRGGPAAVAMTQAKPIFEALVGWLTTSGADKAINDSVAAALSEATSISVQSGVAHPWIPNVIPDMYMDLGHKQVCVEFHHTTKDEPGVVADYVLKKLNVYMNQLQQLIGQ